MPAPEGWVPLLQPQIPVCCEQVQGSQQCPADAFGPHGGLFLKGVMVTVISINHGTSSFPFFFCVQFDLDAVSFWGVWFVVWALVPGRHRSAPVLAAASVGARRSPLGSNTRAGRRDMVLHEPLKELVGGFGGEEGHGLSPFIGDRKRAT